MMVIDIESRRRTFMLTTTDTSASGLACRLSSGSFAEAAGAYYNFRLHQPEPHAVDVDSWRESYKGDFAAADLIRDLHHSDPQTAFRLALASNSLPKSGCDFMGFQLVD